jgi:hypothetical protein
VDLYKDETHKAKTEAHMYRLEVEKQKKVLDETKGELVTLKAECAT